MRQKKCCVIKIKFIHYLLQVFKYVIFVFPAKELELELTGYKDS